MWMLFGSDVIVGVKESDRRAPGIIVLEKK
ncbi:Hypothetical protein BJL86_1659 [Dietzia timorensis]|uniref:Uncharacterized protein n=1 Tax=Dietzia timorensis TaxID=499555 RepID=A0A173LJH9_9ACTN|nr:Hypothetical protein BJL86_1659 [Dietzia timorensis]